MDGKRATWRFGDPDKEGDQESGLRLGLVYMQDGRIRFIDGNEATDLDIAVTGSAGEGGELRARGEGKFRGEATRASVRLPNIGLHEGPLEIEGEGTVGRTKASAKGTLAPDGRTLDLDLKLAGQTFKDLSKVTGMVLPDSPPYALSGRLVHRGKDWVFDPFKGKVGDSDLAGALTYAKGGERPFLKADLSSKLLDFDDLGPIIGATPKTNAGETASPEQRARAAQRVAAKRILPEQEFQVDAWAKMDADVTLVADKVQRPKQLPIDKLSTHLVLRDSVLTLKPLDFGVASGRVTSRVVIDGRKKPAHGEIHVDVQGLKLAALFPTAGETMQEALGTLYGRADLKGRGTSVAQLLGTSDGKMALAVDGGRIGALLVELIGLDVAESLMLLGRKHEQVELRCAVSDFEVKGGIAHAGNFVVDTSDTIIKVSGDVSLREESLDIETKPYPKDLSPLAVRTPLTMKGPLRDPKIRPKPGPLAARVAAAAALGAIAPPLAALALIETGPGKDAPCGELLAQAKQKGAVKKAG
jgi:AsmA family protein